MEGLVNLESAKTFFTGMKNKTKQSAETYSQFGELSKATVEIYSGILSLFHLHKQM